MFLIDNLNLWNSYFIREALYLPFIVKYLLYSVINLATSSPALITLTLAILTIILDNILFSSQTQL